MSKAARESYRRFSDEERRARLVARHHLDRSAAGVEVLARDLVALHSTDPVTPFLSARARVAGFEIADLDRALFEDRTLLRIHAMRRTLFVVPSVDLHVFHDAVGRDIARRERQRLEGWVQADLTTADGDGRGAGSQNTRRWLSDLEERILDVLAAEGDLPTKDLGKRVPDLATKITIGTGNWTTHAPISSRLLLLMAMDGRIVRTRPAGSWRSGHYRWAATSRWLGGSSGAGDDQIRTSATDPERSRIELLGRYLARFGPATLDDVCWWTGWGVGHSRKALAAVGAELVGLECGSEGFVLPGDTETSENDMGKSGFAGVAFLPALDPTVMGWKQREWYLGPHAGALFDRNGNAGPTIWADGRVVGGWGLSSKGSVAFRLLEPVRSEVEDWVTEEAALMEEWLEGAMITPRFRTPLEKALSG